MSRLCNKNDRKALIYVREAVMEVIVYSVRLTSLLEKDHLPEYIVKMWDFIPQNQILKVLARIFRCVAGRQ